MGPTPVMIILDQKQNIKNLAKCFYQNYVLFKEVIKLDEACKLPTPALINALHFISSTSIFNTGPVTELLFVFKSILLL